MDKESVGAGASIVITVGLTKAGNGKRD